MVLVDNFGNWIYWDNEEKEKWCEYDDYGKCIHQQDSGGHEEW